MHWDRELPKWCIQSTHPSWRYSSWCRGTSRLYHLSSLDRSKDMRFHKLRHWETQIPLVWKAKLATRRHQCSHKLPYLKEGAWGLCRSISPKAFWVHQTAWWMPEDPRWPSSQLGRNLTLAVSDLGLCWDSFPIAINIQNFDPGQNIFNNIS